MKKLTLFLFALTAFINLNAVFGQNNPSSVVAVFNGNQESFNKELASKTVSFTLKNLDENSRTDFENKAKIYSSFFTIYYPTARESKTSQVYVLTLLGKTEIKMLSRLFVSANIHQVEFNGATIEREDFFKPYMN
jgi:hypothetical protein